jgi:tetratricopeptide (TPR) repeat protein
MTLGEVDAAVADYTQMIATATVVRERGSALVGRGEIYGQRSQWQAAIDDYARFLDENPSSGAWIYGRLAAIYLAGPESVRNPQQGLQLARLAVQQPDAHAAYRTILGAATYRAGKYLEAAQSLEGAAREPEGHTPFNRFFLAMTWHKLGEADKARRCYQAALYLLTPPGQPLERLLRAETEALLQIKPADG